MSGPERCPVCAKTGRYVPADDRVYHQDGTDNVACWVKMLRGHADKALQRELNDLVVANLSGGAK